MHIRKDLLRRTIESLAQLKYDDERKSTLVVCDGNIVGSGNDRPTPRIVLDILGAGPNLDPEPLSFVSLDEVLGNTTWAMCILACTSARVTWLSHCHCVIIALFSIDKGQTDGATSSAGCNSRGATSKALVEDWSQYDPRDNGKTNLPGPYRPPCKRPRHAKVDNTYRRGKLKTRSKYQH